jgi:hypothetical protein
VKAYQAGTSLYLSQDAYQFIDVEASSTSSTTAAPTTAPLMSQTISYTNGFAAGVVGKNFVFDATASSGLPVAAAVVTSSAGICTLDAGNVLNLIAEGSCEILLQQPGDAQFLAASPVTVTINVVKDFCPMQPCNCTVDECSIFSDWNMKPDENVLIPSGAGIVVQQDVVFGAQSVSNVFGGTGKVPFKVMGRATLGGIVRVKSRFKGGGIVPRMLSERATVVETTTVVSAEGGVVGSFDAVQPLPADGDSCSIISNDPPQNSGAALTVTVTINDDNCSGQQQGLSTEAIIGIAVGSAVGVAVIVAAVVGVIVFRRQKARQLAERKQKLNNAYQNVEADRAVSL